jgi:hypothetical protein
MSENTPSPFAPFMPNPIGAETPAAEKPAKAKGRPKKIETTVIPETAMVQPAANKPPRKTREKKTLKTHAPKFDLQTALAAFALLNEADHAMFEKLVIMLDDAGKPQRDRVLAAIGKVFG